MWQADPSQNTLGLPHGSRLGLNVSRFDERRRRLCLPLPKSAGSWDYAPLVDLVVHQPALTTYRFIGQTAAERLAHLRRHDDFQR